MPAMEVILLGTGSPLPNPDRCGAGQVIVVGDERIAVDLGWGAARRLYGAGTPPQLINTLFFTHLHSDHITDTPDFLIQRWTGGATTPLTVYGPEGTHAMIEAFLAALSRDISFRFAHHGEKLSTEGIRCVVHEVEATPAGAVAAEINGATISAFEVDHRPVKPAFGYRFESAGSSIALSGDTGACAGLSNLAQDADILVCEALNTDLWSGLAARIRGLGNERGAAMLEDVPSYHITTLRRGRDRPRRARQAPRPLAPAAVRAARFAAGRRVCHRHVRCVQRDDHARARPAALQRRIGAP